MWWEIFKWHLLASCSWQHCSDDKDTNLALLGRQEGLFSPSCSPLMFLVSNASCLTITLAMLYWWIYTSRTSSWRLRFTFFQDGKQLSKRALLQILNPSANVLQSLWKPWIPEHLKSSSEKKTHFSYALSWNARKAPSSFAHDKHHAAFLLLQHLLTVTWQWLFACRFDYECGLQYHRMLVMCRVQAHLLWKSLVRQEGPWAVTAHAV